MKVKELIEKLKTMPENYDIQIFGAVEAEYSEIEKYMKERDSRLLVKTSWEDINFSVDCDLQDKVCIVRCGDFELDQ